MDKITLTYRTWRLEVTDSSATATREDGERFECHRQPSAEDALRVVKNKVEDLEGPEKWDSNYTDGALK